MAGLGFHDILRSGSSVGSHREAGTCKPDWSDLLYHQAQAGAQAHRSQLTHSPGYNSTAGSASPAPARDPAPRPAAARPVSGADKYLTVLLDDFIVQDRDADDPDEQMLDSLDSDQSRHTDTCQTLSTSHATTTTSSLDGKGDDALDTDPDLNGLSKSNRLREKNKQAQRRHRQKEKELKYEHDSHMKTLSTTLNELVVHNTKLRSRNHVLECALSLKREREKPSPTQTLEQNTEPIYVPSKGWEGFTPNAALLLTVREQPFLLTQAHLKNMQQQDFCSLWKAFVEGMAQCLVDSAGPNGARAKLRIEELKRELCSFCAIISLLRPALMRRSMGSNMEACNSRGSQNGPEYWQNLEMSLQLTERQTQELLQTRQIYLEGLGKLLRERADLYAVFQSQQIVCFESHLPSQGFARTFDAAEQLSENLREEQRIWTQMIAVTFRRTLQSWQLATMLVQAWPFAPDVLAVINCAADHVGA
ncbi:hypothetical protein WJX74_003438 [Apatococcus lobatus]|uniref:BZIP domain-containing protein n=1 Tax=Apatococcus lobatus TaxID=904363 RepID=A0AAW1RCS9_9CHLO